MYAYIKVNALFNILYCLTVLSSLVSTCVFFYAPVMCSQVYRTEASQYFKIIAVFFMGNAFKVGSNVSYLSFAFSRLICVSLKKHYLFYATIKRIDMKVYTCVVFLFGVLSSLFILFQYNLNAMSDGRKEFPYEKRNEIYCSALSPLSSQSSQCDLFNALKSINQLFNGIVVVILNFLVDLCLIKVFNKEINTKMKMKLSTHKVDELMKKKENLSKMVIVNGLIYFVSHMPKCVTTLLLVVFTSKLRMFCIERISCDLLNEEAEFFALFSMISNFYIFKYFNPNFQESYRNLKARFQVAIRLRR